MGQVSQTEDIVERLQDLQGDMLTLLKEHSQPNLFSDAVSNKAKALLLQVENASRLIKGFLEIATDPDIALATENKQLKFALNKTQSSYKKLEQEFSALQERMHELQTKSAGELQRLRTKIAHLESRLQTTKQTLFEERQGRAAMQTLLNK